MRATSLDGSFTETTYQITIADVNEHAVNSPGDNDLNSNSVAENAASGTAVGITASALDADSTNNLVSYSLLDNANGRFSINAQTGVIVVANGSLLDYETITSHTLIVRAVSSDGSMSQSSFTVQVLNQQERPTAIAENYDTTFIDDVVVSASGLLSNDSDPDGDPLTAVLVSGPATGTLTLNSDGSFIYDPAVGIDGVVSFVYRAFDGVAFSDGVTVMIVIRIPAVQAPNSPVTPTSDQPSNSSSAASSDPGGSNLISPVTDPSEATTDSSTPGTSPAETTSSNAATLPQLRHPR